jgi:hypothetical protein
MNNILIAELKELDDKNPKPKVAELTENNLKKLELNNDN